MDGKPERERGSHREGETATGERQLQGASERGILSREEGHCTPGAPRFHAPRLEPRVAQPPSP